MRTHGKAGSKINHQGTKFRFYYVWHWHLAPMLSSSYQSLIGLKQLELMERHYIKTSLQRCCLCQACATSYIWVTWHWFSVSSCLFGTPPENKMTHLKGVYCETIIFWLWCRESLNIFLQPWSADFLFLRVCFVFVSDCTVYTLFFMSCHVSSWCFTLRGSVFYLSGWRAPGLLVDTELCLHSFGCSGTPLCLDKENNQVRWKCATLHVHMTFLKKSLCKEMWFCFIKCFKKRMCITWRPLILVTATVSGVFFLIWAKNK